MEEGERVLTNDLNFSKKWFYWWRLRPNPEKTEVRMWISSKQQRSKKKKEFIQLKGLKVNYNFTSKYLRVALGRSLTFRNHIEKLQKKFKMWVNLIWQLCSNRIKNKCYNLRNYYNNTSLCHSEIRSFSLVK